MNTKKGLPTTPEKIDETSFDMFARAEKIRNLFTQRLSENRTPDRQGVLYPTLDLQKRLREAEEEGTLDAETIAAFLRELQELEEKTKKIVGDPTKTAEKNAEEEPEPKDEENKISLDSLPITPEIEALFQKNFRLAQEDLKGLVGETAEGKKVQFSELSPEHQLLLLENLKAFALESAKEQAIKKYRETETEKYLNADKTYSTRIELKIRHALAKTFRRGRDIAETEKELLHENPETQKEENLKFLKMLLSMSADGPEMKMVYGEIQINFLSEDDFGEEQKGTIRKFNDMAGVFARTPASWAYGTKEEQKKFQEAKRIYLEARKMLTGVEYTSDTTQTLARVADVDAKVQMTQLFATNPELEKKFASACDQNTLIKGLFPLLNERGGIMALGYATRAVSLFMFTGSIFASGGLSVLAAAGVSATSGGIIGGIVGGRRTWQEQSDRKILGRMDEENKQKFQEASKVKAAGERTTDTGTTVRWGETPLGLAEKLEYTIERLSAPVMKIYQKDGSWKKEEEIDPATIQIVREKQVHILEDRIHYTEKLLEMGHVHFGEKAEGAHNRYELLRSLSRARVAMQMEEPNIKEEILHVAHIFEKENDGGVKRDERGRAHVVGIEVKIRDVKEKIDKILAGKKGKETREIQKGFLKGLSTGVLVGGSIGAVVSALFGNPLLPKSGHENTAGGSSLVPEKPASSGASSPSPYPSPTPTPDSGERVMPEITTNELKEVPGATPWGGANPPAIHSEVATALPKLSLENSFHNLEALHTVKSGDRVWKIVHDSLFSDKDFAELPEDEKNNIIGNVLRELKKLGPEELKMRGFVGFHGHHAGDINNLYPGNTIDLRGVVNEEKLADIFQHARNLHTASGIHETIPSASHHGLPASDSVHHGGVSVSGHPHSVDIVHHPKGIGLQDQNHQDIQKSSTLGSSQRENATSFSPAEPSPVPRWVEETGIPVPTRPSGFPEGYQDFIQRQLSPQFHGRIPGEVIEKFYRYPIHEMFRSRDPRDSQELALFLSEISKYTGIPPMPIEQIPLGETPASYFFRMLAMKNGGVIERYPTRNIEIGQYFLPRGGDPYEQARIIANINDENARRYINALDEARREQVNAIDWMNRTRGYPYPGGPFLNLFVRRPYDYYRAQNPYVRYRW